MAGEESPEKLPIGWTEQIAAKDGEKLKFYYNIITGQKFYCKADLLHYIELGSPSQGTHHQTHHQNESNPDNRLMQMPAKTNNAPDWLPEGWTMELKAKSNGPNYKYKVYTDPSTGRKFLSKPQILRYLNSEKDNDSTSEQSPLRMGESIGVETPQKPEESQTQKPEESQTQKPEESQNQKPEESQNQKPEESQNQKPEESQTLKGTSSKSNQKERSPSNSRPKKIEIVRCVAEGLPEGWIKEIKMERTGNKIRKDPYFTDPESNYVFRSMPDALRYVKTKDLRSCAIKPRKREDLKFLSDDTSISEEKQSHDNTEEYIKEEENDPPTQPPKTPISKRKRGRPVAARPSDNYIIRQEEPAEVTVDSTKSDEEKVPKAPSRSSTRIAKFKQENVGTGVKVEENLEPENVQKLEGSPLDPCLKFSFKSLRSDIPIDANNLAAQGYDHKKRASGYVGLPSFSDYARR